MQLVSNPFRPGTAAVPPHLAGRDRLRQQVLTNVSTHGNNFGSFIAMFGPRGLGKTVLLAHMRQLAEDRGWATVHLEAVRDGPVIDPLLDNRRRCDRRRRRRGGDLGGAARSRARIPPTPLGSVRTTRTGLPRRSRVDCGRTGRKRRRRYRRCARAHPPSARHDPRHEFYRGRLERVGIEVIVPDEPDRTVVHEVIYDELVQGRIEHGSKSSYLDVIERLLKRGAEGVIAGCTEIELLVTAADVPVPYFPTTRLHVDRLLELSLAEGATS